MTPCLRPEELIDALDGCAGPEVEAHVATCRQCHSAVADLRAALAAAESADVPEPSPLFWSQVNARVRAAIGDEAGTGRPASWWAWLRWDVVVPVAGLATVLVALASAVGRVPAIPDPSAAQPASVVADDSPLVAAAADNGALELMFDLAATMPATEWETLGMSTLPDLGVAAQSLSVDEQRALSALLQAAVERPPS